MPRANGLGGINVDPALSEVTDIPTWLETLNSYAADAFTNASDIADKLGTFTGTEFLPITTFNHTNLNHVLATPPRPSVPQVDLENRNLPTDLLVTIPTVDLNLGDVPELTASLPSVNLPTAPNALAVDIPEKTFALDLNKPFPTAPDSTLPSLPTLLSLDLPDPISIATPIFTETLPDSSTIDIPGNVFSFTEDLYSSTLLTDIKIELDSRLSSSTGLSSNVEQALWNRERDREQAALLQAERTVLVDRSSSGFTRPTGATLAALEATVQESQGKIIELSREVMIKQAELEQENFKFSMQQAISLEDILIREHSGVQQRAFEVAKFMQEIVIEIFKASVSRFNSEVEAFKAAAVVFEARVSAELSKVEVFKAEIEAQQLKGDINEQNIRIYTSQIEAIQTSVEIFKTKVSAVSEELRAEGLKIDVYKADIDAYTSLVSSKSEEFKTYSEQIKGELAKVDIYDSQVKAYVSRIQAYSSTKDVELKQSELAITAEDLKIKKYLADVEAYIQQVRADQLIYQSSVDIYKGELQLYLADVGYNTASAELALKESELIIDQNKFDTSSAIERIKIRANIVDQKNENILEGLKSAGGIYSQLANSSLNAVNISASSSESIGYNLSENYSGDVA